MTDEIHSILASAAADVEKAGVPDDLRAAAFAAAVGMRTAGTTPPAPAVTGRGPAVREPGEDDWRGLVASAFNVEPEDIDESFDLDDNRLRLTIPPSRLAAQRAAAMRQVALLVSGARQAAALDADGWTAVSVVRDECRDLGVLDGSNFAAEISQLADLMSFRGTGRSRHVKVNRRGYQQAGHRLRELLARD